MNFADALDEAAKREQQMINIAIANRSKPGMVYTGECHWRNEPIDRGHFCSDECRTDHEKMMWAQKQRRLM